MNKLANQFGPVSRRWIKALAVFAIAIAVVRLVSSPSNYDGSKIAAGTFPWPDGCQPRRYERGVRLPKPCFDRFQKLSHSWIKSHGLKLDRNGRGKTTYHRIGNDAVDGMCVAWENSCTIQMLYPDMFVVDPRIADTTSSAWRTMAPGEKL